MLPVLIIEDEAVSADKLERLLLELDPEIEVLDKLDTVEDAVQWLREHTAALIFLDIHLADGLCFTIFEQVEVKTPIIFTTAYDQYAIQAFQVNSVDYLLKPVRRDDLARSLEKFKAYSQPQTAQSALDYAALAAAIQGRLTDYQKRFVVFAGEKIRTVPIEEVAYFFAEQRYVFLVTHAGPHFIIDKTLDHLEGVLDPDRFFRINRKFIIGIDAINNMFAYSKSRVKIELNPPSDSEAIVSVERSGDFKRWLDR